MTDSLEEQIRRETLQAAKWGVVVPEVMLRVLDLNRKYEINDRKRHGEIRRGDSDDEGSVGGDERVIGGSSGDKESEGVNYQVILGRIPVLFSAPHAVRQTREGKIKMRDGMTGGIAECLCEELGAFGVMRLWNAGDDPNYGQDERSMAYRDEIVELVKKYGIKWVFDVHGCLDRHGFDIDVGINGGGNLASTREEIEVLVEKCWPGLDVRIDGRFGATRPYVVSNYVHRMVPEVNCVQLELSEKIRLKAGGMEEFYRGMKQWVEEVV